MQHPPPRETGQENQPVEHVYADRELEIDVGSGVVLVVEVEVGTTAAVVEIDDVGGAADDVEVEGWT
jgi:hypothetical protein